MTVRDWLTDGVVIALLWIGLEFVKQQWNKRKQGAETGDLMAETLEKYGEQIDRLENKVIELRERIEALEAERDDTLKKFNELKAWVRGLLKQLDAQGVQYEKPRPGLLDTGEHKAIK